MNDIPSNDAGGESDILFLSLVFNFQAAALQQMGKMVNPMTGKADRDMASAKQSIDLLDCLERKTKGNLAAEEERAIQEILTNLRLNYIDELKRGDEPTADVAAAEGGDAAVADGDNGESEG